MDAVESRTDEPRASSSSSSGAGDYNSQRGAPGATGGLKHTCAVQYSAGRMPPLEGPGLPGEDDLAGDFTGKGDFLGDFAGGGDLSGVFLGRGDWEAMLGGSKTRV